MKKILWFVLLLGLTCCKQGDHQNIEIKNECVDTSVEEVDSQDVAVDSAEMARLKAKFPDDSLVIEETCKLFEEIQYTPEEAAHWDSLNAEGQHLIIRGAERELDTTVNHTRIVFITEK